METTQPLPVPDTRIVNPVQEPQIFPFGYALPIWSTRFSSPAGSACVPQSLIEFIFGRR